MPESPPNPGEAVLVAAERRIRWDALAAVIAALVGLLALIVAGYTAYIQRQQVSAQVWPYLQMGKSNADGHYQLEAINKGVGPAIVQSVQVLADGKPIPNWKALEQLFGFRASGGIVTSTLNKVVIAPGEQLNWIAFQNAADVDAFLADWVRFGVEARICYSSTLGENWLVTFDPNRLVSPSPVQSCQTLPASMQFVD